MSFTCHISGSLNDCGPGAMFSNLSLLTGEHGVSDVSGYDSDVVYLVEQLELGSQNLGQ